MLIEKLKSQGLLYYILLIFLAIFGRLIFTGIPNFSPIGAIALFSGFYFKRNLKKMLLPFSALLFSDFVLSSLGIIYKDYLFSQTFFFVYLAFGISILLGTLIKQVNLFKSLIISSLASSVIFFLVSNFGVWLSSTMYAKTFEGLMMCYTVGLAFYQNSFFGNFFLNGIMSNLFFGIIVFLPFLVSRYSLSKRVAKVMQ